jgi:hypothetical protein
VYSFTNRVLTNQPLAPRATLSLRHTSENESYIRRENIGATTLRHVWMTLLHFPPLHSSPLTMWDYFKSKFDYHWDTSGGWRFIAAPGNISFNQQKLIPREQTPKQLPGYPRRTPTLAHEIYKTVFRLMDTGSHCFVWRATSAVRWSASWVSV